MNRASLFVFLTVSMFCMFYLSAAFLNVPVGAVQGAADCLVLAILFASTIVVPLFVKE